MPHGLIPGLYELLVTQRLEERLGTAGVMPPEALEGRSPQALARHVGQLMERVLRDLPSSTTPEEQVALVNSVLGVLRDASPRSFDGDAEDVRAPARDLIEVVEAPTPGGDYLRLERPTVPLSESALFVNGRDEPSVGNELNKELASADRVDLLIPFVRWTGVRIVRDRLGEVIKRGGSIRVIASTYLGASEAKALEALRDLGAQVKVSYDTTTTRLHAKAWLFERNSGFSTALIGSSNLSSTALLDGLEWNVRLSAVDSASVLATFRATFESYWHDAHVEPYDRERFQMAIQSEGPAGSIDVTPFDIHPFPFQMRILEQLDAERQRHNRHRNLVVSATGTGKTVVAALDYKRLCVENNGEMSLLFVAHRKEILDQSRRVFRHVLKDGAFGEKYVDGQRPSAWKHVFASVQALATRDLTAIDPGAFDMVIVDEFHHGAAPTYRRLLEHFKPKELLGLTATPERSDGQDQEILDTYFDGRFAAELRLWDAIDGAMLCPFQYFGVHDDVDLSRLQWKRGGYDQGEIENLYTGNDARVAKVLTSIKDIVADPLRMRALGFCVSVAHAHYMADTFRQAGIPSVAVSGDTPTAEREAALADLRVGNVNCVFAVDLFNEGIDVPAIDTVLFLRPTESATVFLQQLGRGLRRTGGKACLTVLDFIGNQHTKFRFDRRLQALLPAKGRTDLERQVRDDFPFLPSGCFMTLDRMARQVVLDNIRTAVRGGWREMASELRELGDVSLEQLLGETQRDLADLYRSNRRGWVQLRRDAGLGAPPAGDDDQALVRAVGRMLHINDAERLTFYEATLAADSPPSGEACSIRNQRLLTMLHFDLWQAKKSAPVMGEGFRRLWAAPAVRAELREVLGVLDAQANAVTHPLTLSPDIPLQVHASYSRDEVLAAVGASTPEKPRESREGVLWVEPSQCDLFFVTLNKDPKHFSTTTAYRDYAISPTLFHWESQSTTTERSPTGQRYINHRERGSHVLFFVRSEKGDAYVLVGPASYVSHTAERPIEFTWLLDQPLPAAVFDVARRLAA